MFNERQSHARLSLAVEVHRLSSLLETSAVVLHQADSVRVTNTVRREGKEARW